MKTLREELHFCSWFAKIGLNNNELDSFADNVGSIFFIVLNQSIQRCNKRKEMKGVRSCP